MTKGIKIATGFLFTILLSSCVFPLRPFIKKSFDYYEKDYDPEITHLKFYAPYVELEKPNQVNIQGKMEVLYTYFHFFDNGLVKEVTDTRPPGQTLEQIKKPHSSDTFGYFKVKKDSLFFSTKSFYNKHQIYYKGKIENDTIVLTIYGLRGDFKKNN